MSMSKKETEKKPDETWSGGSLGIDTKQDCFRTGRASCSASFMVDSHTACSVLLKKPSDVELPRWTVIIQTYVKILILDGVQVGIMYKNPSGLLLSWHSLRFWGWMSEARPSEWDRRPLTDLLLVSPWSNWPQVMCILWSMGFTPSGSMRGLLGYIWNPLLFPVMDLYTLRLLLWLWL